MSALRPRRFRSAGEVGVGAGGVGESGFSTDLWGDRGVEQGGGGQPGFEAVIGVPFVLVIAVVDAYPAPVFDDIGDHGEAGESGDGVAAVDIGVHGAE